jgi:AsmA protein
MKKALIVIGIVVVLLILIVIALPLFINVNRFKPTLENDLTTALGRKVDIGNIELAILSGGVTVDNVSIADDPAFSHSPFLQAKKLTTGVDLMPLIFDKKLQVRSFTITEPQVSLIRAANGTWNYSSLGNKTASSSNPASPAPAPSPPSSSAPASAPSSSSSSSAQSLSVASLKISNGSITVGSTTPGAKTQTYQNVDLTATDLSYTSQFPFTLTANTPGSGSIKIDGKIGPINPTDASLTPLTATINVSNLDLASTGFVDASSGLAGVLDFTGDIASDGQQATSKGTVKATKMKVVAAGSPSKVPVNVDYTAVYDLKGETGTLKQGDVHVGRATAHLAGDFDTKGPTAVLHSMKLTGQGMPVPDLEGALPAVGVMLPAGSSLQAGSLDLNLGINGPVDKLVIAGTVNLTNGKLAGFNLKQKLGALSSFAGLGGGGSGSDTDIQKLSSDIHMDPSGIQATNLILIVPSMGTVTGNGTVGADGKLNCKMSAKLAVASSLGAATSALSAFTGGGSKSGGGGLPFKVEGTTSHPIFLPDLGGMASGLAGSGKSVLGGAGNAGGGAAGAASQALGGLFGKKKK